MISNTITNFTCNGKCSCCGQCCGDILHLSKREIKDIAFYVKKHKITATPQNTSVVYDNTCPFRDNEKKICKIYEVRPEICRTFICSRSAKEAYIKRDLVNFNKKPRSMRNLFYKDNTGAVWIKNYLGTIVYDKKDNPVLK